MREESVLATFKVLFFKLPIGGAAQLNNSLTQWKCDSYSFVRNFTAFMEPKNVFHVYNKPSLGSIKEHLNSCFSKIHFNIILLSLPGNPKWSLLSLRYSDPNFLCKWDTFTLRIYKLKKKTQSWLKFKSTVTFTKTMQSVCVFDVGHFSAVIPFRLLYVPLVSLVLSFHQLINNNNKVTDHTSISASSFQRLGQVMFHLKSIKCKTCPKSIINIV
jgi:hypothetical protein